MAEGVEAAQGLGEGSPVQLLEQVRCHVVGAKEGWVAVGGGSEDLDTLAPQEEGTGMSIL